MKKGDQASLSLSPMLTLMVWWERKLSVKRGGRDSNSTQEVTCEKWIIFLLKGVPSPAGDKETQGKPRGGRAKHEALRNVLTRE